MFSLCSTHIAIEFYAELFSATSARFPSTVFLRNSETKTRLDRLKTQLRHINKSNLKKEEREDICLNFFSVVLATKYVRMGILGTLRMYDGDGVDVSS